MQMLIVCLAYQEKTTTPIMQVTDKKPCWLTLWKKWNIKRYDKNGNVLYEIKDGKGWIKEYDSYDTLIFEGEYSDGFINGKGKEYDYYGELRFEGEYLYGKK